MEHQIILGSTLIQSLKERIEKLENTIYELNQIKLTSSPSQIEVKECEHKNTTIKKGLFYCNDCPVIITP